MNGRSAEHEEAIAGDQQPGNAGRLNTVVLAAAVWLAATGLAFTCQDGSTNPARPARSAKPDHPAKPERSATPDHPVAPQDAAASAAVSTIDHRPFDELLKAYVKDGWVDYAGLSGRQEKLDRYLQSLEGVRLANLNQAQQLVLYINAYNAATLRLILDYYPGIKSIKDIPSAKRWKAERWLVAGEKLSLDAMEHEVLRKRFKEPRIHFAIVCASVGCPDLRAEAFVAQRLEPQLTEQAERFNSSPRHVRWDPKKSTLHLSSIYEWFAGDFEAQSGTVVKFVARYCTPEISAELKKRNYKVPVKYLDYDWALNGK